MKVTIKDVAKSADVSIGSVSRVIRKVPGVKNKTREKVLNAIDELGYELNTVARNLRQKKTNTIGLVLGDISLKYSAIIAKAVTNTANKHNYSVTMYNSDDDPEKEVESLKMLRSQRVDGVINTPSKKSIKYINYMHNTGTRIVLAEPFSYDIKCDGFVSVNNFQGAHDAVKLMLDLGYRRIGMITGNMEVITSIDRLRGYNKAFEEKGITVDTSLIKNGDFTKETAIRNTEELLNNPNRPEAIFTNDIPTTMGTLMAIKKIGLKIPDDVGLVGFDDPDWAIISDPPITTIRQPIYDIGVTACELLLRSIEREENSNYSNKKKITIETKLIIRDSLKKMVN